MKILIVDDSKAMQSILAKSMQNIGYHNDTYLYASDGKEALTLVQQDAPDLMLTDLHMPNMSGIELLEAVQKEARIPRSVIVSTDSSEEQVKRALAAGADAYLKKPFTPEQLYNTVAGLPNIRKGAKVDPLPPKKVLDHMPSLVSIERVLSSLAESEVTLSPTDFSDLDFTKGPFAGATFTGENQKVFLAIFMDVLAANALAAIVGRQSLGKAITEANIPHLSEEARHQITVFFNMFTGLYRPSANGILPALQSEQFSEHPQQHLKQRLTQFKNSTLVLTLGFGENHKGKIAVMGAP